MQTLSIWTALRFSIQLFICEAAFLAPRTRRRHFVFRLPVALLLHLLISYGWFFLLRKTGLEHALIYALFFLGIAGISIGSDLLCFDLTTQESVFIATCGYATEHITFAATRIITYLSGGLLSDLAPIPDFLLNRFLNYCLVSALIYLFVVRPNSGREIFREKDLRFVGLAVSAVIAAIVFSAFYTSADANPQNMFFISLLCPLYSGLCCFLILVMEYFVFRENRAILETESMEHLLQISKSQQRSSKAAIDIINLRCHDLKHQMKALLNDAESEEKRQYIEDIRNAVVIYDSTFRTGCEALDYILYEKKLLAEEIGCEFLCMADGRCVAFLTKPDLYALMGNALDNAIEHLQEEPEAGRSIFLSIKEKAGMAHIHLENTCTTQVYFDEGIPITTKPDKESHGFGVKSILYIAKKYHGEAFMDVTGGRFCTDVILPRPVDTIRHCKIE